MHLFNFFIQNPPGEGFGFNGNILETNIINLAVVIGILVYFGGDFLSSLLENRKKTIVKSLDDAEARYQEAMNQLKQATAELESANNKAEEILQQGRQTAASVTERLQAVSTQEAVRLQEAKDALLKVEQDKAISQVCETVVLLAISQTKTKVQSRLTDASLQDRILKDTLDRLEEGLGDSLRRAS